MNKQLPSILLKVALLAMILLVSAVAFIVFRSTDKVPTLYHHAEGHFTLNSKFGSPVSESDWADHLSSFRIFGRARLVASETTRLSDFARMLDASCARGVGRYRLESGELAFSFHAPGCGDESENECDAPQLVDLSGGRAEIDPGDFKFDIVILAMSDIPCRDLLAATSRYAEQGKSVAVIAKPVSPGGMHFLLLHHRKGESGMGEFIRPPNYFQRHLQPYIQTLKYWFS